MGLSTTSKMLRKKEKKALASILMLLIGWPVGLDQFLEGNNEKGIFVTIGWTVSLLLLFFGWGLKSYDGGVVLIVGVLLVLLGSFLACKKLIKVTRAFVDADD